MAIASSILIGIGVAAAAASAVGIGMQMRATSRMAKEQKAASIKAENARQQQNQLDAMRRRRQAIREAQMARANAVQAGVNQGAGLLGSGVLAGAGNATSTGNQNQQTLNSAQTLGNQVFDANRSYAMASARGQVGNAWGSALTSIGGLVLSNLGTIGRVGGAGGGSQGGGGGGNFMGPEWPQNFVS